MNKAYGTGISCGNKSNGGIMRRQIRGLVRKNLPIVHASAILIGFAAAGVHAQSSTTHYYSVNDGGVQGSNFNNDGATGQAALAAGVTASAAGAGSVAVGHGASASGMGSTAIGFYAGSGASGANSTYIGSNSGIRSSGDWNMYLGAGSGSNAVGDSNSAFGSVAGSAVKGNLNSAFGYAAGEVVTGNANVAMGVVSGWVVNGVHNVAIGSFSGLATSGTSNLAVGSGAGVGTVGNDNVASGSGAGVGVNGSNNIAIGRSAGTGYTVGLNNLGIAAEVRDRNGNAVSEIPAVALNDTVAVGNNAYVTKDAGLALGVGSQAIANVGDVALGAGSVTAAVAATPSAMIAGTTYSFAGVNPTSTVSVGASGNERTITNVAAGRLSGSSTDAVNGSQLYATMQAIQSLSTAVADGQAHYYSVNDGGAPQANYTNAGATGTNALAAGISASAATAGGVALGTGSTADRAGMNGRREDFSNISVQSTQGAVSVGSSGNERQITNVAGGTAATDAVNVRQLRAIQQGVVNYGSNPDGTVDYSRVALGNGQAPGGTVISNVAVGVAGTDAVNVNQLNAGIAGATAYTDARVGALQNNINSVARRAYAGVASAMAMESAPYIAGKTTYAAGAGYYQGQGAMAVTLRRTASSGRWSVTGGVGASAGGMAARVGVAGVLN